MAMRVYRVVVVGCPRATISSSAIYEGVGKSCLCNRFVRSEAFVESHTSTLTEEKWYRDPVTNGDHFIYWGAATKHLPDGSKARFQVVEQTEFYKADETQELVAHASNQDYLSRASALNFRSSSGGKTAFKYKTVESGARRVRGPVRNTQLFPNEDFGEKSLGVFGYVCVFDPSLEGHQMENQLSFWSTLLPLLAKRKRNMVMACVKCDAVDEMKISFASSVASLALKKAIPFVEVSAKESVNVEEVFFALVGMSKKHKAPKNGKRPVSSSLSFKKIMESRKGDLNRAKDSYRSLLQKKVTQFSTTWSKVLPELQREPVYRAVLELAGTDGEETVLKMFQLRLIEIKLKEAGKLHGLQLTSKLLDKGNSQSYQDYLSSAFKGHPDLGNESLYDYVYSPRSSVSDASHSDDLLTEPSLPSSYRNTPDPQGSHTNIHISDLALSESRPRSSTFQEPSNQNAELFKSSTLPRIPSRTTTQFMGVDPPPLPPRALDVLAAGSLKALSQSHTAMEKIPEATQDLQTEKRRLSNSMDCLLISDEADSGKEQRLKELVAEPYLQPVEVQEMMALSPSLPQTLPSPKTERAGNNSVFMSMRVRSKTRPPLPHQATTDCIQGSAPLSRSLSFQRGHKRSRSNPWVLEGSSVKPPQLPPRNTEPALPNQAAGSISSGSVFGEAMSPIESSLEFGVRPPLPPTPRKSSKSPSTLQSRKGHDESNSMFDSESPRVRNQSEGEIMDGPVSPSLKAHSLLRSSRFREMIDEDDDDLDDSTNQYARIEDMQKYVLMSSAPAKPGTFHSNTIADREGVDSGKRSLSMTRPPGTPKKELPTTSSAPLITLKRKWKKMRNAPVVHDPSAPSLSNSSSSQSPSHQHKSRPLPPSPTKVRRILSKQGSGNVYEAIDDLKKQLEARKQDSPEHVWFPPVKPELLTKYVKAVRMFFAIPEVKERWLETLKTVMPDEQIESIPPPLAGATDEEEAISEQSTPSPQPKLRHKSSISTTDDVIIIEQPNSGSPSRSSFAASPSVSPFHTQRTHSLHVSSFQSPDQKQFQKSPSRDDLIQILNQQLNTDSLSSDSESEDSSGSSDEDSDLDNPSQPQQSLEATPTLLQTDLDEALGLRASVSTDSDLVTEGSREDQTSGAVAVANNVNPTQPIKKRATHKRRNQYFDVNEASRNLSDSGISNCHSQTFEDGFSAVTSGTMPHNSESEC